MTDSTYDEARRCPRCGIPGDVVSKNVVRSQELRPGTTAHVIFCRNRDCTWLDTSWVVQVNPDGTIPPPNYGRDRQPKQFPVNLHDSEVKRIVDGIEKQVNQETQPGGGEVSPRR
jgi:hypothetical protein